MKITSGLRNRSMNYLGIAAAALLGLGAMGALAGDGTSSGAARVAVPSSSEVMAGPWVLRVVLVGSEAEKDLVHARLNEDALEAASNGVLLPEQPLIVIKGSTMADDVLSASGDLAQSGRIVSLTDLTFTPGS